MPNETVEYSPVEYSTQDHLDVLSKEFPGVSSRPPERFGRQHHGELDDRFRSISAESLIPGYQKSEQQSVPEALHERIEKAIIDCEIEPSREVRSAIISYYKDHYELAALVDGAIEGSLTTEQVEKVLEHNKGAVPTDGLVQGLEFMHKAGSLGNPPSVEVAAKLLATAVQSEKLMPNDPAARRITLECAAEVLQKNLFQEEALALTTLGNQELGIVNEIYAKLKAAAIESEAQEDENGGFSWETQTPESPISKRRLKIAPISEIDSKIKDKQEKFWDDCRLAGQLEFHNTGHIDRALVSNGLMSRNEQYRRTGTIRAQTDLAAYPAGNGRKRMHSNVPHFSEFLDPTDFYTRGYERGTLVLPLAEIIKRAPFARDARYAVVMPKTPGTKNKIPVMTHVDKSRTNNLYSDEIPSKYGSDRVFFASPTEQGGPAADSYQVEFYLANATQLYIQGRDYQDDWREVASKPWFYTGENLPTPIFVNMDDDPDKVVADLQAEKQSEYGNQVVVPLRRGVFDYNAENIGNRSIYRQDAEYNMFPEDVSEQSVNGVFKKAA